MKRYLKIIGILAVLCIVAALLIYKFIYNKPHRDYEKAKAEFTIEASAMSFPGKLPRNMIIHCLSVLTLKPEAMFSSSSLLTPFP